MLIYCTMLIEINITQQWSPSSLPKRECFCLEIQLLTKHTSKSQAMLKDKWQHCSETVLKRSVFWSCCNVNMHIATCSCSEKNYCVLYDSQQSIYENKINWILIKSKRRYETNIRCTTAAAFQQVPPGATASVLHVVYNEGRAHCESPGTFSIVTTLPALLHLCSDLPCVQPWVQEHTQEPPVPSCHDKQPQ